MIQPAKAEGCLLGLACGDALGRPVEFKSAATVEQRHGTVDAMLGYGSHGQPAGTITDDTELALCIARSLVACDGFDGADVAERFVGWYETDPFDIGLMTTDALARLQRGDPWDQAGQAVWESRREGSNAGNGSVMRCAPYALAVADDLQQLGHVSEQSSAITHADPRCKRGCAVLNLTIAALLRDEDDPLQQALEATYPEQSNASEIDDAVEGLPGSVSASEVNNGGYVVDALQAGLYYALSAGNAEDAIVRAVNAGGDADTVGAITGAVAGARFGAASLPDAWLEEIDETAELRTLAGQLLEVGQSGES
ncbi:ADP-ribosylglycohydrolase family protein [Halapricum salinum]|uniref:ADP-ribosylglycohydrolase family protein n=1 Tax=Halapricum salinum TaxID=1457250 RepID=A0A4D6HBE8_9EURY|nr:ADP-ribosylglycohydrolase family protein [Halapricum salinum]QCC51414.1 ADP-ribosylglycohydrolase family protein [Halapricum salinum]